MIQQALEKAESLGSINNSITRGKGNVAGYLAEIALNEYLNSQNVSCNAGLEKFNFDLIKGGKKIEVKTKRRTVDPQPHYEVSIAETSKHQQPDVYSFVSITFKKREGRGRSSVYKGVDKIWLCGFMPRDEYFERARFIPKGEIDPSNNFLTHANMFNMKMLDLYPQWSDIFK